MGLVNFKWSYLQKDKSNMTPHSLGNFWTTLKSDLTKPFLGRDFKSPEGSKGLITE